MSSKDLKIGQIINFGNYAGENIEWEIVEVNNDNAVLVSKKVIDTMIFDNKVSKWENSQICLWLNSTFYENAFNEEEKQKIIPYFENDKSIQKVVLLSKDEVLKYYKTEKERIRYSTDYAKEKGLTVGSGNKNNRQIYNGSACWWTRTEKEEYIIFCISISGLIDFNYIGLEGLGIVPTIRLIID